jgi:tripartite-type tricarboxylate transporter receptor subunit TctC
MKWSMIGLDFLLNVKKRKEEVMKAKANAMLRITYFLFLSLFLIGSWPTILHAEYPEKPITLIVPMSPGGTTDLGARLLAEAMEKELKLPVVVVNKPGGAMTVGGYATATAKPDGYTLGFLAGAGSIPEAFTYFYSAPYSSHDLRPICRFQTVLLTITVKGDAPWNNLKELIEYARKNPRMKYGTHGKSTQGFVIMTTIAKDEKVSFVDIAYGSDGEIIPALLGGHIPIGTPAFSSIKSLREAKKVKVLATLTEKRADFATDVPTVAELGYKLPYVGYNGLFGPKKTPDEVVKKIDDVVHKILEDKEFQNKARNLDLVLSYVDPASFERSIMRTKENLLSFFKEEGLVK